MRTDPRMPMLSLRRPAAETTDEFLAAQAKLGLAYSAVGATAASPPEGYTVDDTRIKLGEGEDPFMDRQRMVKLLAGSSCHSATAAAVQRHVKLP
jgi:uncharacterized protein (UPF0548 family)